MDDIRQIEEEAKMELDQKIINSDIGAVAADDASAGKLSGLSNLSMN